VTLGLAYRYVADADELDRESTELAARLAAGPTRSLGLSKQLLNATFETDLSASLDREAQAQAMATVSPEMAEGMAAFSERRDPDFRSAR
jgi:2-(1,2-epoxy-1,2-dihydrophenyl)acetyl-CoA isomerase